MASQPVYETDTHGHVVWGTQTSTFHSLTTTSPTNAVCFQCSTAPAPWVSVTYGIYLCITCAGLHRELGVHLSFVRSTTLDKWTPHQMHRMVLGGNAAAAAALAVPFAAFPSPHQMHDLYSSPEALAYRQALDAAVERDLGPKPSSSALSSLPGQTPHTNDSTMTDAQSAAFYAKFQNATAISSADINGDPQPQDSGCCCSLM